MDKETEKQALEAYRVHYGVPMSVNDCEIMEFPDWPRWLIAFTAGARGRASGQQGVEDYALSADKLLNVVVSLARSYRGSLNDERHHEEFTSRNENLSAELRTKLAGVEDAIDKAHSLHAQLLAASPQITAPSGEVVVTKNESGQIVAVTRKNEEGQVLTIIAESAAQPSDSAQGWKPIETAPKDGTHITVINAANPNTPSTTVHWFEDLSEHRSAQWPWNKSHWHLSVNQMGEYSDYVWGPPTHWQPLPKPPGGT